MNRIVDILFVALLAELGVLALEVKLSADGTTVLGANITITATVIGYSGEELRFDFSDNAVPEHSTSITASSNVSKWTISYPKELYRADRYEVYVKLNKQFVVWFPVASASLPINISNTLNGQLVLSQNQTDRPNTFVAVNQTVTHQVKLPENELAFLTQNASTVITYWFIDCIFIAQTVEMSLNYTYTDLMGQHLIDVLVVANNEPLPPITTTPIPTTTTTQKPTTTTTLKPNATTTVKPAIHNITKRAVKGDVMVKDFICHNTTIVPIGDSYTYGHYQETIGVRQPISSLNITGGNWLKHGELMNLVVKYSGSPPFDYCVQYKMGIYNITGNETCHRTVRTVSNDFPLVHYFSDSEKHTVVVIIENDIGKTVSRAAITIYKVAVHAQLSVIIMPVVSCLLAVILIVFGIAYYQHRSRNNTIEVADFDFGQQAHLDYKTFSERLRESFRETFHFVHQDDTEPLTNNTRYNSME